MDDKAKTQLRAILFEPHSSETLAWLAWDAFRDQIKNNPQTARRAAEQLEGSMKGIADLLTR